MTTDKKELLKQQITKIEEVLKCLQDNFADCEIDDEVSFMTIAKDNLIKIALEE